MKVKSKYYFLIIGCVLILITVYFLLPRLVTQIKITLIYKENIHANSELKNYFEKSRKETKFFKIKTKDKLSLDGFYVLSSKDSIQGSLILLHGIRSSKAQFKMHIDSITNLGYHCFAIDLRAHGLSEGTHCTFGYKEKNDIFRLIDYIKSQNFKTPKIGILGYSLGGAIAIQSLAEDDRLNFGIIQSSYSKFDILIQNYVKRLSKIDNFAFTNFLIQRSSKIADYNPNAINPKDYISKIQKPILFFHGSEDDRINIKYGKENYNLLHFQNKQFITIENANHVNLEQVGKQLYWNSIKHFLTLQH